nr:MAG TPA: hypothetical protein [Caudoviricetes sp.]
MSLNKRILNAANGGEYSTRPYDKSQLFQDGNPKLPIHEKRWL